MKVLRTLCTAIALAACAASPSLAVADEAPVQSEISLQDRVDMIRADVAEGELSCVELMGRINDLLAQIDSMLDRGVGDKFELLKFRNVILRTRSLVTCTAHNNHSDTSEDVANADSAEKCELVLASTAPSNRCLAPATDSHQVLARSAMVESSVVAAAVESSVVAPVLPAADLAWVPWVPSEQPSLFQLLPHRTAIRLDRRLRLRR